MSNKENANRNCMGQFQTYDEGQVGFFANKEERQKLIEFADDMYKLSKSHLKYAEKK